MEDFISAEDAAKKFVSDWLSAFRENGREFDRLNRRISLITKKLRKDMKRLSCYLRDGKRPRYYHTSIEPKRQNRTRKKQRLTRLQRRWKRQNRRG